MRQYQTSVRGGYEDILCPMEVLNVTQGDNMGTHKGTYAADLAGSDTGRDLFYAPFSVVCKAIDEKNGNAVWWESLNKVRFADGTIDFATIMTIHDNNLSGIYIGATYAQGTQIAQEGMAGYATGNHIHFEIAKGTYDHMYDRNEYGVYHLPGNMPMEKACFGDDTIMRGYASRWTWTYTGDASVSTPSNNGSAVLNEIPSDFVSENAVFTSTVDKINIRRAPSLAGELTGDWYENGMSFRYDGYVKRDGYVWCSYIGSDDTRRWVAVRKISDNNAFGTFK